MDQTQRSVSDNDYNDDGSDKGSDDENSSLLSSSSKSVAVVFYNDIVLLSLSCHKPVVKSRVVLFYSKSNQLGFVNDFLCVITITITNLRASRIR